MDTQYHQRFAYFFPATETILHITAWPSKPLLLDDAEIFPANMPNTLPDLASSGGCDFLD